MRLNEKAARVLFLLFAASLIAACGDSDHSPGDPTRSAHLGVPRLFFSGEIVSNVGTGNNNNVLPVTNAKNATIRPEFVDRFSSEEEFRKFMESPTEEQPSAGIVGGWNYYGDMRVAFRDAKVTGFQEQFGAAPSSEDLGPFENASILAPASVMTDVHPSARAGVSTRWTFATLAIADADNVPLLSLPVGESSFYWFAGASVRYFFTVNNEDALAALQEAPAGSVTAAFLRQVEAGAGLAVQARLDFGNGIPGQDGLAEKFARGEKVLNPFIGPASGVITPWFGEFEGEHPPARYLLGAGGPTAGVVTAAGDMEAGALTFDFGSSGLPADTSAPSVLSLRNGEASPPASVLATFSASAYNDQSSEFLVDVEIDDASGAGLASADLVLTDDSGKVVFRERPGVVTCDPIGLWLDEGDSGPITLQVLERGAPSAGATIFVQQYGYEEDRQDYFADRLLLDTPASLTTDENGIAVFEPRGIAPGRAMIAYRLSDEPFPNQHSDTDGVFDTFVRVLAAYDDSAISDDELTWDVLYREVLEYYDIIFPGMNVIFDLGDEETMRRGAPLVLSRLEEIGPESPYYMPVTRDMPAGKRKLLERWLKLVAE